MDPYAAMKPGLVDVSPQADETVENVAPQVEETFFGNVPWRKFKQAFQQTAMMMPGAKDRKPLNRKELRDLLRHDPTLREVGKRVFGNWRTR